MAAKTKAKPQSGAAEVDAYLAKLKHPLKPALQALRALILAAGKEISEGIKWNSPSFRTREWFATANVRGKDRILIILHLGAKVRPEAKTGITVDDPDKLLQWLAKDRAMVSIENEADLKRKSRALKAVIRSWVQQV